MYPRITLKQMLIEDLEGIRKETKCSVKRIIGALQTTIQETLDDGWSNHCPLEVLEEDFLTSRQLDRLYNAARRCGITCYCSWQSFPFQPHTKVAAKLWSARTKKYKLQCLNAAMEHFQHKAGG